KASSLTFGLQAASETDGYAWKRFSDKAFLRVKYNLAPTQVKMSQLTMEYGGTCKRPEGAPRVRTLGKVYANNITDPDGDNVAVQFQAMWDTGDGKGAIARWKPALTSYKASGSSFVVSLPTSIPQNKTVNWYVRSYDGAQYSPWSSAGDPTGCYFVYDTTVPKAPAITSGDYPASDPENPDDPWFDGVGRYGSFQIKAADSDVTKYWYGINGDPSSKNVITTAAGAAQALKVLPSKAGLSFITAQAFDAAGNGSEVRTYQFRVKAGQPERANWKFDDAAEATSASGGSGARTAKLYGGATPGASGTTGTAVHFDGTSGYAATDIPTVNTANGFSVSAWVNLDKMPTDAAVVAAQPGNYSPGFELYYSKGYDRWVFNQYTSDTAGASIVRAMAPVAGGVTAGRWTHLVGVYSGGAKELRLYVDGSLAGSTPYTTAWDARRGLQIGAANLLGTPTNYFPGSIDDVRIFDKPVSDAEVTNLHQKKPIGSGRTARAIFPLDEAAGATEVTGHADTQPLALAGNAKLGAAGVSGRALQLDGDGDYARTAVPHVDTERPFTVSAWAKADPEAGISAVLAQDGTVISGVMLWYNAPDRTWRFGMPRADGPDWNVDQVISRTQAVPGVWTRLTGVHDAVAGTITLYVDGAPAGTVAHTATWAANGPFVVGRDLVKGRANAFWDGQVQGVEAYDYPMTAAQALSHSRTLTAPTVKAALPSTAGAGCQALGGYGTVSSRTPTLTVHVAHPDPSKQVWAEFGLWDNTDPAQLQPVALGTPGSVSGKVVGRGTVSLTAPTLIDGHSYGWRARTADGTTSSAISSNCHFRVAAP
ncbi:LamG domain-containing protein, partial [Streptomyces microflavus]|uniref:LamG domain-containing protein n=1 Tax=Streptomyces microflavus TaxID=1919 RepID=UPI003823F4F5